MTPNEIRQYLKNNIKDIPFAALINDFAVEKHEGNIYIIHIVPEDERIVYDDIKVERASHLSKNNIRKRIFPRLFSQEKKIIEAFSKEVEDMILAAAERWRKTHRFSKKMTAFLSSEDCEKYFSKDAVKALRYMTNNMPVIIDKLSLKNGTSIAATLKDYPYSGSYNAVTGRFTSPFRALASQYDRIEQNSKDAAVYRKICEYLKEKKIEGKAEPGMEPGVVSLYFYFPSGWIIKDIMAGRAYKSRVMTAFREASMEAEKKQEELNALVKSKRHFGTFLSEAVIDTVLENDSLTEKQIIDLLCGVNLKDFYKTGKYTGMFNMLPKTNISSVISQLIKDNVLKERAVCGEYGTYYRISAGEYAYLFRRLEIQAKPVRSPKTEQEYRLYLQKIREDKKALSIKKEKEIANIICEKTGIFCADPYLVMDIAENLSDKGKEYLHDIIKNEKEDKILTCLDNAAKGKRKKLPTDGYEFMQKKRGAEEKRHRKQIEKEREKERKDRELFEQVLTEIPDDYTKLYPLARKIKRHFVLHIGPTNSGKTYAAIEDLKKAETGIYLAPLRLLAFEQYEAMNRDGCPCSLLTGEEQHVTEGALHQSSTIEMLNIRTKYDIAVIDEAQMISDEDRGGAWAAAVMGVRAETVHVCAAPEAENLLIRIIRDCGDSFEVMRHERKTPLVFENRIFRFPEDVRPGDALIVFSRKDVHSVAAELQKKDISCSIIYGALPYDVRHKQAELFAERKTQAVVSTDAIGMGMNLPIRRVVFMETKKFDGKSERPLYLEEIRQIAGRAGRYGIYDTGSVAATVSGKRIKKALDTASGQIEKAVIGFPESLLSIDATLTQLLTKWLEVVPEEGWKKGSVKEMLKLAQIIEKRDAPKKLKYEFVSIPFDTEDITLLQIWHNTFINEATDTPYNLRKTVSKISLNTENLYDEIRELENIHKKLDLYFNLARKFQPQEETLDLIMEKKRICSEKIMKILEKQELKGRRCSSCGKMLPWNYPYGMCEKCYSRMSYGDYDYGYW